MKVLFLSAWYPNRYDSMAGLFVQKHAEAVSLYADVKVLYVHGDEKIESMEIVVTKHKNIEEFRIYYPISKESIFGKIRKIVYYFRAYQKGIKAIKETGWKPDVTQANVFTRTAFIAYLIKLKFKTPYVVIEHWTRYFRNGTFKNRRHKWITGFIAGKASCVMPVTYHLQKCMESKGMKNDNYQVINNVVDDVFFEKYVKTESEKVRILNVTCFDDAQKNITGILRVVKELTKKRKDFEFYFIGIGSDFELIKQYASSLHLESDVVHFTGLLEGKKLAAMYQDCDFTVLFSNYENIPVVVSESLACGKPVISTDVGGINEHITPENGILISAKDEKALVDSLDWMIDHYKKYDAEKIANDAYDKYSNKKVGKNLKNIYLQLFI